MELLRSAQGDERPKKATLHRENRGGRKQSVRSSRSEKHARLDISLGTPVPVVTAGPPVLSLLSHFVTWQVTRDNSASLLVGIYVLNRGGLARPVCQRGMQSQSAPHRVWVYVCERATPNAGVVMHSCLFAGRWIAMVRDRTAIMTAIGSVRVRPIL
jgi:hypothetical protein